MTDRPMCPCKWCGTPTPYTGTKECDRCHNITSSLSGIPDGALLKILSDHWGTDVSLPHPDLWFDGSNIRGYTKHPGKGPWFSDETVVALLTRALTLGLKTPRHTSRHAETRCRQLLGKASFASKADWYAMQEAINELIESAK